MVLTAAILFFLRIVLFCLIHHCFLIKYYDVGFGQYFNHSRPFHQRLSLIIFFELPPLEVRTTEFFFSNNPISAKTLIYSFMLYWSNTICGEGLQLISVFRNPMEHDLRINPEVAFFYLLMEFVLNHLCGYIPLNSSLGIVCFPSGATLVLPWTYRQLLLVLHKLLRHMLLWKRPNICGIRISK